MSDLDKDIEIVKEINEKNNFIFYEKVNNVFETLKKNEFPLQFKSDLTDVIDALINNQINSNVLSACEMIMKNQTYEIQKEKENCYKKRIEFLNSELETYKKIAEKLAEQVKRDTVFYDTEGISSCDLSEEKYCKCSKHNNGANCKQCIIDWARKEVENGNNN